MKQNLVPPITTIVPSATQRTILEATTTKYELEKKKNEKCYSEGTHLLAIESCSPRQSEKSKY